MAILFPNKENPDNRLRAGEEYTLFGSETGPKLTMAKGLDKSKIIFFVTKEPILKNFLKIQDGEFIMRFSIRDKVMNILYDILKAASTTTRLQQSLAVNKRRTGNSRLETYGAAFN